MSERPTEPNSPLALLEREAERVVRDYKPGDVLECRLQKDERFRCRVETEVPMAGSTATVVDMVSSEGGHEIGMAMPDGGWHWNVEGGAGELDDVNGQEWVDEQLEKLLAWMGDPAAGAEFRAVHPDEPSTN